MCGSLLSKFKETKDIVDHAKSVSPDPLKLIDKVSLKKGSRVSRKDGDRNGEPSVQSLAKIPRKTSGVNMSYSLTQEGFEGERGMYFEQSTVSSCRTKRTCDIFIVDTKFVIYLFRSLNSPFLFLEPRKGVVGNSACYQHIRFQKGGESRSAPSMALCPRNKSVGAAIFSSLSDVECLQRALNGAKSSTGSERFQPKVGEQNTKHPLERQKQEVEGGTFDLQDLETYEASDSDDPSWGD